MNKIFLSILILSNFFTHCMEVDYFDFVPKEDIERFDLEGHENIIEQADNAVVKFGARGQKNKCYVCEEIFEVGFKKHAKTHRIDSRYICDHPGCKSEFKVFHELNNHIYIKHNDEKPFKCLLCAFACKKNKELKAHLIVHSQIRSYKCNSCDCAYKTKQSLDIHILAAHSDIKPYKCTKCEYSTKQKKSLKDHIKTHENKKEHKCDHLGCKKAFNQLTGLLAHKKKHLELYKCAICGKNFINQSLYDGHMNTHNGLTPYACNHEECDRKFTSNASLLRHKHFHLGTYKCTICNKSLSDAASLKRHMNRHDNNKKSITKKRGYSEISEVSEENVLEILEEPQSKRSKK